MSVTLPQGRAPLVDKDSRTSPDFYRWMAGVTTGINAVPADASASISAIATKLGSPDGTVAKIPVQADSAGAMFSGYGVSVTGNGSAAHPWIPALSEVKDSLTGALRGITVDYFGRVTGTTDATITGTAGEIAVVNGNAVAGVPTLSLATVTDVGGGTLQRTVFDTKGRKTGTSAATTDHLTEGVTNLYFTNARAIAAVGAASSVFNRIDTSGDIRVDADGNLRISS